MKYEDYIFLYITNSGLIYYENKKVSELLFLKKFNEDIIPILNVKRSDISAMCSFNKFMIIRVRSGKLLIYDDNCILISEINNIKIFECGEFLISDDGDLYDYYGNKIKNVGNVNKHIFFDNYTMITLSYMF